MSGRREILERVAAGDLSPEEAERLLREDTVEPGRPPGSEIRRLKVSVGVGGIDIIGDPAVAQAEVDGPHRAEVMGDELVIHGEWDDASQGFTIGRGRRVRVGVGGLHGGKSFGAPRLRIRVNPAIELDAELDAGPLSITDIDAPIRARVAAGPITIERFSGPLDVAVNAGAIRAVGRLTQGESRIRSDAGAVRVELEPDSSVRVFAQAALGKVVVPGSEARTKPRWGGDKQEAEIGGGDATLRVETAMGSVHVSVR